MNANNLVSLSPSLPFKSIIQPLNIFLIGLGDDQPFEVKKPRRIPIFDTGIAGRRVIKIVCGGLHTVALTNMGQLFSWGCNDDGALGRDGPENTPLLVDG